MKTFVITGGSHGLGKALAEHYAKDNTVVILSSNEERLARVAHDVGCEFEVCDVRDWDSVAQAVGKIGDRHGHIDVLINNAGLYARGKVEDIDPAEAKKAFDVNILGPLLMAKAVVPGMKERGEGYIININSQGGINSKAERTIYSSSKWALTGMTKSMQPELAPFGIKVTGLYPGALELSMESSGEVAEQPASVRYDEVVDAVDYVLRRRSTTVIPEFGMKHLDN